MCTIFMLVKNMVCQFSRLCLHYFYIMVIFMLVLHFVRSPFVNWVAYAINKYLRIIPNKSINIVSILHCLYSGKNNSKEIEQFFPGSIFKTSNIKFILYCDKNNISLVLISSEALPKSLLLLKG